MKKTNAYKTHLERLLSEEENQHCFDCDKKPAHWASINNGIYLCFNCSGDHRGLGVSISYIRSVTLDAFNENQVKMMDIGGNKRLAEFLSKCDISRRMLKAFANEEAFNEELPDRNDMINSYTSADNYPSFNNRMININNDHYTKTNRVSSVSSEDSGNFENKMININENHYSNSVNYSKVSSDGKKFESVKSNYNNDSRFASISSEPIENYAIENDGQASTSSKIYSFLGSAFDVGKTVAGAIKEKVSEMEIGSKLVYTGGKTVEALKYTGSKVIEKGSDIAHSDTMQNISQKASDGLNYLMGKFFGKKNNEDRSDDSNYQSSRYSGVGSEVGNSYSQMGENKNEKFLYNRDKDSY